MARTQESKQTMWETWFVISVTLFVIVMMLGVNQEAEHPTFNWTLFALISTVNLIISIIVGTLKHKE